MQYRILGKTNLRLSVLGFGASPLGNVFEDCDEAEGTRAVHCAIDQGINFFDVAPFYGTTLAETRLGKALVGKRHQVVLATKCGRNGLRDFDFSYDSIIASADASLTRLKTDYIDLMQLHDIEFGSKEQVLNEAVPAIQKIKESGKARFIGITGLPVNYLAEIARVVEVDTVLSWAHYNLLADGINAELVPLSKEKGFGLMNAAPLVQRILSDAAVPSWHNAPQEVKDIQPSLLGVCKQYGVSLSDLAIWYAIQHKDITTTIVGMCDAATVLKNVKSLELTVPAGLMEEIAAQVEPVKNRMWFEGRPENNIQRKQSATT
jgi:L-galactose dehydrogenase